MALLKSLSILVASFFMLCTLCNKTPPPPTFDDYLQAYTAFIHHVSENHRSFTEEEFARADRQFLLYSRTWYDHYQDQLSTAQRKQLNAYQFTYDKCRLKWEVRQKLDDLHMKLEDALMDH